MSRNTQREDGMSCLKYAHLPEEEKRLVVRKVAAKEEFVFQCGDT